MCFTSNHPKESARSEVLITNTNTSEFKEEVFSFATRKTLGLVSLWEIFVENPLLNEMVKGTAGTETGLVNEQGKKEYNR